VHTLEPGAKQEEGVMVVNNSAEPKTMIIYAADSTPSTGGSFACKQLSEPKDDVGAWITLEKSEVTLDPGTNETVPFIIKVPKNASAGEHNGCILIQEKKAKTEAQAGASISVRTGLRVAIMIPGEITRKLEIVGFTLAPDKGGFLLQPKVKNDGNVSIDADAKVMTNYFFGAKLAEHGGQYPILRGEISDWNFELKKPFWGGWYRSSFSVEYDANAEAGVGVKSGKAMTTVVGPTVWFWSSPTLGGLAIEIAILAVLIAGGFLLYRRGKRAKWIKTSWVSHEVMAGQDIQELAKTFKISWKTLAKANKLRPPYALKPGEQIKVPPVK
jgi:hypothetical protein